MVSFFKWLKELVFCSHDWQFVQRVEHDYNLRTGRVGPSVVSRCTKCGKHQTVEIE